MLLVHVISRFSSVLILLGSWYGGCCSFRRGVRSRGLDDRGSERYKVGDEVIVIGVVDGMPCGSFGGFEEVVVEEASFTIQKKI